MRGMLKSLNDPYTRFLSPSEFASLSKYDITGVGLNIVDAPDSGSGIKVRARAYVSPMTTAWHGMESRANGGHHGGRRCWVR